jgi:hypothetical protein
MLACLSLAGAAVADTPKLCPSVSDYSCLVRNSLALYRENHERWWSIYRGEFEKAKVCRSYRDIQGFLELWAGETDGEMAEALTENTGQLMAENPKCFFEGALLLSKQAKAKLVQNFCPWLEPTPQVLATLKPYARNRRFRSLAKPLVARIIDNKC